MFLKLEIVKKICFILVLLISVNFGIIGLLYGSVLNSLIALFVNTYFSGSLILYSLKHQLVDLLPILILAIFTMIVVYFWDQFQILNISTGNLFRVFTSSMIAIILYLSGSYIFKFSSLRELHKLKTV